MTALVVFTAFSGARHSRQSARAVCKDREAYTGAIDSSNEAAFMARPIQHINRAGEDLSAAARQFASILDADLPETEYLRDREVALCRFRLEGQWLILVAPTAASSPVAQWLEKNGPGLFLLSFGVGDLDAALAALSEDGIMPSSKIRIGLDGWRVVDIDLRASAGIPLHLTEEPKA